MATITSSSGISSALGQYSGITSDDIDQLLAADATGKTLLQNQVTDYTSKKTAWGDVTTRLNNFLTKVNALQDIATYHTKTATSSDSNTATITGSTDASEGTYDLVVKQLATATKITGSRVAVTNSKTALNTTGTLTLTSSVKDSSGTAKTFDYDITADDTLVSIAAKINKGTSASNISANIVDNRLVLTNKTFGAQTISASGSASSALGLSQATTTIGQTALLQLDGLDISRDSNTITDVLDGATITLKGVSASSTDSTTQATTYSHTTLTLANDNSKTVAAVNDVVNQYNSMMSLINDDLDVGDPSKSNNTVGALSGDNDLINLQESLRSMITQTFVSGSSLNANQVGISQVDKDGTIGLDTDKLTKALTDNPTAVKDFFYQGTKDAAGVASNEQGYSVGLRDLANKYLTNSVTSKGIIPTKTATFDSTIKDLNSQIDDFDTMLALKKEQYVSMFTNLDTYMMNAQSQLSYFTSQLSSSSS